MMEEEEEANYFSTQHHVLPTNNEDPPRNIPILCSYMNPFNGVLKQEVGCSVEQTVAQLSSTTVIICLG